MVGFESAAAARLLASTCVVLLLSLGIGGCEQAADPAAPGQTPSSAVPGDTPPVPAQAAPGGGAADTAAAGSGAGEDAAAGSTMSAEEISRHFKVKTTDAASAAAQALESAGSNAEQAVEEATR